MHTLTIQQTDREAAEAAARIEDIYAGLSYDHRPYLDLADEEITLKMTEEYRTRYACFKYAVSKVLQPHRIVEVGVGSGVSALAFLHACPTARYTGLDSGEWQTRLKHLFLDEVDRKLSALQFSHQIVIGDSQSADTFPYCDLCHIDGDHSTAATRHDFTAAWRGRAKWILVDDAEDPAVAAGVFQSLSLDLDRGSVDWAYFANTWTGNILVRTDHWKDSGWVRRKS